MNPRHRIATRALMITPENRFLLFLSHFEPGSGLPPRWVFPGGGLEPGETPLQGIIREILEETGLEIPANQVQDLNIKIDHQMEDRRKHDSGEALFFEVKLRETFIPSSRLWTADEHRDTVTYRWWTIQEIQEEEPWIGPDGAIDFLLSRLA